MLPPRYTKTVTVTGEAAQEVRVTATYSGDTEQTHSVSMQLQPGQVHYCVVDLVVSLH